MAAPPPSTRSARHDLALRAVLRVLQPLVRMLVREGVTFPALAAAMKTVFVDAARAELDRQNMKPTASALSLLSGVHRKDLRALDDPAAADRAEGRARLHIVGQVVARWMTGADWHTRGKPKVLRRDGGPRSFDALVASVSTDVRARAVLDDMLRLGVIKETNDGLTLAAAGIAPRRGFDAMSEMLAANLHDHAAGAVANIGEGRDFLDQAVFVDELTEASVVALRREAMLAWQAAFTKVMAAAQQRFDHDARSAPAHLRTQRLRFGTYCYDEAMTQTADQAANQAANRAATQPASQALTRTPRPPRKRAAAQPGTSGRGPGPSSR